MFARLPDRGHVDWAREKFLAIDANVRKVMASVDYTEAERRCPNQLPIGRLIREAVDAYSQYSE